MTNKQIALWTLAIGVIAVIIAGVQLYPAFKASPHPGTAQPPVGTATATATIAAGGVVNCAGVNNTGAGGVDCSRNINIGASATGKPFDKVELNLDSDTYKQFQEFIDAHDNKIVRMNLRIDDSSSLAGMENDTNPDAGSRLVVTYSEPCEQTDGCGGTEYVFVTHDGGNRYRCNGAWCIDGYFSVEPVQGVHQGYTSVGLVGIADGQARLSDPQAR